MSARPQAAAKPRNRVRAANPFQNPFQAGGGATVRMGMGPKRRSRAMDPARKALRAARRARRNAAGKAVSLNVGGASIFSEGKKPKSAARSAAAKARAPAKGSAAAMNMMARLRAIKAHKKAGSPGEGTLISF